MSVQSGQFYLEEIYGADALYKTLKEVETFRDESNIPFDSEYIRTGLAFITLKAKEIYEGVRTKTSLKSLVSESFGEAAIYAYNIQGKQ